MTENETAVFSIHISGTKEAVWRELVQTDGPQDALYHTILHTTGLEPGASYQMRTPNARYVNTIGEILEYDPPNRLKQTVRFVRFDDPPATATYELVDAPDGGVELTLTLENLPAGTKSAKGWKGSGGGEFVVNTLKQIVEDGHASRSTRWMYRFFDVFAPVLAPLATPKRTRVEHWPLGD
ncbi:MAG: SRPBCC domain-containing protein [Actinomycetota bacterium]